MRRLFPVAATLALAVTAAPRALHAQTDPRLVAAVRLAQDGLGDSARTITRTLMSQVPPSDTLYPQLLYTSAIVAATTADMQKALQQIVVEYASTDWVDDALLRLAQLDYANGAADAAVQKLERLRGDFPGSALLPAASLWAARAYFELRKATPACRWIGEGLAKAGADVELANQLTYYNQRCTPAALATDVATRDTIRMATGEAPPPAATKPAAGTPKAGPPAKTPPATAPAAPAAPAPAPAPAAAATSDRPWRIQLAASDAAHAPAIIAAAKAKGIAADTVQEGGFVKVRTGRYATREQAVAAMAGVKRALGGQPFVVRQDRVVP